MIDQHQQLPTLRAYLSILSRRKVTVLAVFLVTTAAVAVRTFVTPPTYTADASLLVKFGREFIYRPEVGNLPGPTNFKLEQMVSSEVEILNSRDLAEKIIDEMGFETIYPDLVDKEFATAKATSNFQDGLSVRAVGDSSVIKLSFEHGNAEIAAKALNLLLEKFKAKHLEIYSDSKSHFLESQLRKYEDKLTQSEAALEAFRQQHRVYELPEQKRLLLSQHIALDTELKNAESTISELKHKLASLSKPVALVSTYGFSEQQKFLLSQLSELNTSLNSAEVRISELEQKLLLLKKRRSKARDTLPSHPGLENSNSLNEALIRLLDLQLQEQELLRNYNPSSRRVESVRREIQLVRDFLKNRGKYVEGVLEATILEELESLKAKKELVYDQHEKLDNQVRALDRRVILDELEPLEVKKATIVEQLAMIDSEITRLVLNEMEIRKLERDVSLSEENFQMYSKKFEQALISEELDRQKKTNVRVIEKAVPPTSPTGPPKSLKLAFGACVGLLAGIAVAFFAEFIKQ